MAKAKRKSTAPVIKTADDTLFKLHDNFCRAYSAMLSLNAGSRVGANPTKEERAIERKWNRAVDAAFDKARAVAEAPAYTLEGMLMKIHITGRRLLHKGQLQRAIPREKRRQAAAMGAARGFRGRKNRLDRFAQGRSAALRREAHMTVEHLTCPPSRRRLTWDLLNEVSQRLMELKQMSGFATEIAMDLQADGEHGTHFTIAPDQRRAATFCAVNVESRLARIYQQCRAGSRLTIKTINRPSLRRGFLIPSATGRFGPLTAIHSVIAIYRGCRNHGVCRSK